MRMIPTYRFAMTSLLLAGTILASPVAAVAQTVVIGSEGAIPPLDPHRMTGTPGLRVIDAIFDPLIREDLSVASDTAPTLEGALADAWEVGDDGLVYTLRLREDVQFHDGSAFNADAVKANFDRIMDKDADVHDERAAGNMTFLTRWIASTRIVDDATFEITLKEPFSGFPRLLSDRRASMISPTALTEHQGDAVGLNPVGTGPFVLPAFAQGQEIALSANDAYWGGELRIDTLTFRPVLDPTALAIAMQTGQIDIIPSASSQQVQQLSVDPSLTIQYPSPANQYFVRLNTRAEFTDNALFRQALNYAINRDNISALMGGQVNPLGGPVPDGNELPAGTASRYTYDPEKAEALLAEAGVENPVLTILAPNSGPGFGQAAQIVSLIQQDLGEVGIRLEPQFLEFATLVSTEGPGYAEDIQGSFNGWTTGADNAYWLERMFGGEQQPPNGVNRGWYSNQDADRHFQEARGETDLDARLAGYAAAADLIAEDAPWIFLYQDRLPRVLSSRVSGIEAARSVFIDYPAIKAE